ncbi:hypothetical protein SAMN03159448_06673 [Sinorhizobium sp. NFACC03]|nr:hypothetical protein SAMN03159448_06673 [Sinorhizobium sp. NFACC03]
MRGAATALDGAPIKWNTYSVITNYWFVYSVLSEGVTGVALSM